MNLQSNTLILKLLLSDEESDDVFQYLKKDDIETLERDFYFLIILTLLYRILTGIYEWLFVWAYGTTPGKILCGLKIVTCLSVTQIRGSTVVVNPGSHVSSSNAWVRSLLKNITISLMLPVFITGWFNQYNRTIYDEASNTIVVEKPRALRNR